MAIEGVETLVGRPAAPFCVEKVAHLPTTWPRILGHGKLEGCCKSVSAPQRGGGAAYAMYMSIIITRRPSSGRRNTTS